jgi:hypothetical protein
MSASEDGRIQLAEHTGIHAVERALSAIALVVTMPDRDDREAIIQALRGWIFVNGLKIVENRAAVFCLSLGNPILCRICAR